VVRCGDQMYLVSKIQKQREKFISFPQEHRKRHSEVNISRDLFSHTNIYNNTLIYELFSSLLLCLHRYFSERSEAEIGRV